MAMHKTALIVDDSKSARVVLKKMLETHELNVDTAESAEDALDYLADHRPDVIFMDHLMPGMDGFEAVTAIKRNPDTATIPIMMYTSQEGEVYVGQARALGAVGVLPKKIAPVEVSKVLQSLRVIGSEDISVDEEPLPHGVETSGEFPALETLDQDLKVLIRELFEQQRAIIRRDLLDSYEAIAARVADEIRQPEETELPDEPIAEEPPAPTFSRVAVTILALMTMIFAWLYLERERSYQDMQAQNAALQRAFESQRVSEAEDSLEVMRQMGDYRQSLESIYAATLNSLEWGANLASEYDFGSLPLGDERLQMVEQLTEQLMVIDFNGVIRIETHVGNFCLTVAGTEGYELANGGMMAQDCDAVGVAAGEAYEMGLGQSVAFANFIRQADQRSAGRIRYEIVSMGSADPLIDYPATNVGMTAGAWNRIARANNRVEITIVADAY